MQRKVVQETERSRAGNRTKSCGKQNEVVQETERSRAEKRKPRYSEIDPFFDKNNCKLYRMYDGTRQEYHFFCARNKFRLVIAPPQQRKEPPVTVTIPFFFVLCRSWYTWGYGIVRQVKRKSLRCRSSSSNGDRR